MERHELIKKYEKRLQKENPSRIEQLYCEIIRDLTELEQTKVKVSEFVAEWIRKCKTFKHFVVSLSFALQPIVWEKNNLSDKCIEWLMDADNQDLFARAWLDGYTIEEKRYRVKMKAIKSNSQYLVFGQLSETWWFGSAEQIGNIKSEHTHKEIEDAGFGEVFNSPLFEVEEVEG
nr:MAG TPA: Protein of unknown function (DUF1642) [Caudoviricetes sp.]